MSMLLSDIATLITCPGEGGPGEVGALSDAALVWDEQGILEWLGPASEIPRRYAHLPAESAGGKLVIPGLIECHTHLAFGGWRAEEFALRARGTSYLEIARRGGGILSSVRATREASREELLLKSRRFLDQMLTLGVTTVEAKSGYGLELETELKQLQVYQELARTVPQQLVPTFLAHTVPPERSEQREVYLGELTAEIIPAVAEAGLAEFCDVFLEQSAFSREESKQILEAGLKCGLKAKMHADQLSSGGGAELAAELGAISADHLEQASREGLEAMAEAGVVAVSLPLASFYLRQPPLESARLRSAGVRLAVATDFNPGSAPSFHLPLALHMACVLQRMSPAEALQGATIQAAHALDRQHLIGSLEPGKQADFVVLDTPSLEHWLYHFQPNVCQAVFIRGKKVRG